MQVHTDLLLLWRRGVINVTYSTYHQCVCVCACMHEPMILHYLMDPPPTVTSNELTDSRSLTDMDGWKSSWRWWFVSFVSNIGNQSFDSKRKKTMKKKNLHGLHKSVTITGGPIPSYFVPDTRDLFFNQNHSSCEAVRLGWHLGQRFPISAGRFFIIKALLKCWTLLSAKG